MLTKLSRILCLISYRILLTEQVPSLVDFLHLITTLEKNRESRCSCRLLQKRIIGLTCVVGGLCKPNHFRLNEIGLKLLCQLKGSAPLSNNADGMQWRVPSRGTFMLSLHLFYWLPQLQRFPAFFFILQQCHPCNQWRSQQHPKPGQQIVFFNDQLIFISDDDYGQRRLQRRSLSDRPIYLRGGSITVCKRTVQPSFCNFGSRRYPLSLAFVYGVFACPT